MAKKVFTGKVAGVFTKKMDEPDQWDNTHKHAVIVRLNEDDAKDTFIWFDNANKHDALLVQDEDENWAILGKGSEIILPYENPVGTMLTAKKSALVVVDLVLGEKWEPKKSSGGTQKSPNSTASSSGSDDYMLGRQFGNCMSITYNAYGNDSTYDEVCEKAQEIYPSVVEFQEKMSNEYPNEKYIGAITCLLYTSPSPRDRQKSRMPSSA